MPGTGTGYPNWFKCPGWRGLSYGQRTSQADRDHQISLTGRTRPTKKNGRGHRRKSWTTREWVCSCGRTGWSSHIDLERMEARHVSPQ